MRAMNARGNDPQAVGKGTLPEGLEKRKRGRIRKKRPPVAPSGVYGGG